MGDSRGMIYYSIMAHKRDRVHEVDYKSLILLRPVRLGDGAPWWWGHAQHCAREGVLPDFLTVDIPVRASTLVVDPFDMAQ
jgi:hypothetical protein